MDTKDPNKESKKQCKRKTLGSYCPAINCNNSRRNCKLSMFRFPIQKEWCGKWVQNTRHEDLRHSPLQKLYNYELCFNHFEESQFTNKEMKKRLKCDAIPTLFDVPNPPWKITYYLGYLKWESLWQRKGKDKQCRTFWQNVNLWKCWKMWHSKEEKTERKVQALCTKLWRKGQL